MPPSALPGAQPPEPLSTVLATWANRLVEEQVPAGVGLDTAVEFARAAVPHAEHGSLVRFRGADSAEVLAATSDVGSHMSALQDEAATGPAGEATLAGRLQQVDDFARESRWPVLAGLVTARTQVRSMIGFPVDLGDGTTSMFAVYAMAPDVFDQVDLAAGATFAPYLAAVHYGAVQARQAMHLQIALDGSRRIGAAMGILMTRELLTFEQAFERLRHASQVLHRKLRDVAAVVVETGEVPV